MPLPFNKNLDLKLLKLVKENPILFNTKHSKYLDFDSREVVWQKIGDTLGRPAVEFAGIQCQIHFGDFQESKHKPGFIENLGEYLPEQYSNAWGVEKKILKAYSQHQSLSQLDAKYLYIKTARGLPTYGVTFFLVKEKQKDKKKLVPRLLGINSEAILRLDEVTKEILQQWPLTHVKTYHAGKSETFTLNFGDYSDKEYSVKTQDAHRIRDILEDYIDIIRRRMLGKPCADPGESMAILHDNVESGRGNIIEHVSYNPSKITTEMFVGPSKIVPFDQGSQAQHGTQLMTVQQIVVTDHLQNQQQALKGEVPVRGDMPIDCVRRLNQMNSNSVKIVTLLTDPTEHNVTESQKIVGTMQEDLPVVDKGVKETAEKQTVEEAKKMLLDELQDLNNYMNKLSGSTKPGHVNPADAKEAAECIADLTTQMYFSIDPKTRRRSDMLRRSRKSFKAGEKTEQTLRRASFVAAATSALHAVDCAARALHEEYQGPKPAVDERKRLEKALEDRMGKLNAAIALYLTAHSDPDNIDYSAAINSMNAINELMPELARDAQILGSTMEPAARQELQEDMRTLYDATKRVCSLTGSEDHGKMQEASNSYADIAGKLIFTFARGTNADKENEIIALAKDAGDKTSLLLVTANELTCQAADQPAAADVDRAGVRTAGAARDLLACAQLTAPAIHEPHCQSALTAAAEGLASSVHHMETTWRPLVEDPTRQHMSDQLHSRGIDVNKALERLKNAYADLGSDSTDTTSPQERQRLKFITTKAKAKNGLEGVEDLWTKSASGAPSDEDKALAQRRLEQQIAQLNAAIAALTAATADRENPDYATAELAISTISELMPQIVQDMEVVSSDKDEATRAAMQSNMRALCDATRALCSGADSTQGPFEAASDFADASGKLVFLISPGADKGKQKYVMELSSSACDRSNELMSQVHQLRQQLALSPAAAAELDASLERARAAAAGLLAVAQVTAPSIGEARCQNELASAADKLRKAIAELTACCHPHLQTPEQQQLLVTTQQRADGSLDKLLQFCQPGHGGNVGDETSAQQEKQRLKFISSTSGAKSRLQAAEQQLQQPMVCQTISQEDSATLQHKLSQRVAQLNAAVAALAAATADRENPDYAAADAAINTITELMPHIVQDSRALCGTKDDAGQAAMLQELTALCEATREICDSAGQPQGVGDAAAKFSAASSKLVFIVSPDADNAHENKVIDLSAAACGKASELLAQVQQLTEQLPPAAAAELDERGARTADAAQALLTIAQVTAPSISEPRCQNALISAAERLRSSADGLAASCRPHLQQRPEELQRVSSTHQQLADSLDKLVHACKAGPDERTTHTVTPSDVSAQQEKQRLKFVSGVSGAKNRLYDAEQQLKQPMLSQMMRQEDGSALQHKLSQRVAQLNAAVAALAAATADRENPDYVAADQAVKDISELMPQVVQDSRKLCGTKDDAGQAAMLQELTALCEATREICDSAGQPQGLSDAAAKFSAASGKMVFLLSPKTDDAQQKQVLDLSAAACGKTSELLAQVQQLTQQLPPAAAAELHARGASTADAAQALLTVAQVAGRSVSEPSCAAVLTSAAERLRNSAADLTVACRPHLQQQPTEQQQVMDTYQQLDDSLNKLVRACKPGQHGNLGDEPSAQQEKQRLKFISSASGAKSRLQATEQQLQQPMLCQMMTQEDGAALQHKLSQRVAQLNAAVAALAAATADRENPDYAAADRAVRTITELMPHVVQDSRKLCGTKDDAGQAAMLQQLTALCEATREICDSAGQPQGLSDAAAKFSAASGKLVFLVSPKTHDAQEKQVLDLSGAACGRTSELLAQVQQLTQELPPAAAAELDARGASTADAAQALLTVAQVTAPSISEPTCSAALVSAAEKLRGSADGLAASCRPQLQQRPEELQRVTSTHHQLADSLDKLVHACKAGPGGNLVVDPAQQEKQRLKFVSSASGAKSRLQAAEQQLQQPMVCQMMTQEDGSALQHKLSQRVAQLNAAVAALAAATADRENPDYAAADQAVRTITELMPHVIQDSRKLCGTKDDAGQAVMLQELTALCEATREICDSAGQAQGLGDAAAKFSAASGKMVFLISPKADDAQEQKVLNLTAGACGKASELLAQVQQLTEQLPPAAAAELDARGARTADAAEALLTVAQLTVPSISEPTCSAALVSAAEKLRGSADGLAASCRPHLQQRPEELQRVTSTHHQLADSLDKLVHACKAGPGGNLVVDPAQQEKQRLKFVSSVSGAKSRLQAAVQQLQQPMVCQMMTQEDGSALQHKLSQRVAQLNAAVAALAAATADRENPDYAAADQAVRTITELMPHVIQDSRKLCGTKDDAGQAVMLQELTALCEATREICDSAGQAQGLGDAAAKFSAASGKMVFLISPKADDAQEQKVLNLTAGACGKASELLAQVQQLTEQLLPAAAAELDARGARTADAAEALLTVAQLTVPSVSEPICSAALVSAAEKLRGSADGLAASCRPHLQQRPEELQRVTSTHHQLADSLDKLVHACKAGPGGKIMVDPAQQEKQRLKFISSVSGAKSRLQAAEQQLQQPMVCQMMTQEDGSTLQHKLSQRVAQLNAAVAALAAATADRENPDYAAADQAVRTITELMPHVIQDSRKLCGTKDDAGQAAMLQELTALCEATREICDSAGQAQGLGDAAAKFSAASGKMVFLVSPKADDAQEQKVLNLTAGACGKASELLAQVQQLTEQLPPAAAAELDERGARTADAAEALLTVAQLTVPSISEPTCSAALVSAAEKLRGSADGLAASCRPHLQQRPEELQRVSSTHHQLADSLDKLVHACKEQHGIDVELSPQQEKQRLKFVSSVSGTQKLLDAAEQQMKQPLAQQPMKLEDGAQLQHQLSRRLAQLNAAVAALAAATCDGKHPNYPAAERAVTTITELMPQVVQESRKLCATKDDAGQAAMLQELTALCGASRDICNSAGQPRKLHEATAKLADASGKLVFLVGPGQDKTQSGHGVTQAPARPVPGKKPAVPARDPKTHTITHAPAHGTRHGDAQDFLNRMREDSQEQLIVSKNIKSPSATTANQDKVVYDQFAQAVGTAEQGLKDILSGDTLKMMYSRAGQAGADVSSALQVCAREQHMEDTLARAGVEVAALVAANYADKLDYKAAMEPTIALTKSVMTVVDDGSVISSSLDDKARESLISNVRGLCEATKDICEAARSNEKLNDAAITFGDRSAKLLRVVSSDVNPTLEKEVISRAKAIGDTASRLALEASNVAIKTSNEGGDSHVQDICTAGARSVDAAGKLVYTAKLIAPTIHHSTCQDALVSSADSLSSSLNTFSNTWKPLASAQSPNVETLTEEARNLEELVEQLRKDIRIGKLGRRREVDRLVDLDTPLRKMTMQIIENTKNMIEHGEMTPELKKEYSDYGNKLEEAVRALDLANARYQRAPHDKNKRDDMEMAIQDLQMMLLMSRPSRAGQEQNNIVDFRDFLQDLTKEADQLQEAVKKNEGAVGKRASDDIKLLCSKISEDADKLLHPTDHHGDGVTVMTSVDDVMDIDQFGLECDVLVKEINTAIQGIQDQKAKQALRAKALLMNESCKLLRFATNSHMSVTKTAAFDEALRDLDNFKINVIKPLADDVIKNRQDKKVYASPAGAAGARRARAALLRASRRAAAGEPQALCAALTYYSAAACADSAPEDLDTTLTRLDYLTEAVQTTTAAGCQLYSNWEYRPSELRTQAILKEIMEIDKLTTKKPELQLLNAEDVDKLLLCERREVEGTRKQLEDKVQQQATKLSSISGTIVLSAKKPESLARSLHAAADVAAHLANTARALQDHKKPVQCKRIEEAAQDMCLATYTLLKTSELVCQDPKHHDSRRKLLDACRQLNDSINKLVRTVNPAGKVTQECGEVHRSLQLQRSVLQAAPQPCGAMPYAHCVDTLHSQRDVLHKLNSDQAMSREEFLKSMHYVATAVSNSTECAAHAAYLLSTSEKDQSLGKEGLVDVPKLHKAVGAVQDTCVAIIMVQPQEQIQDEKKTLEDEVQGLLECLNDSIKKTKDGDLKKMLQRCREDIDSSARTFIVAVNQNKSKEETLPLIMSLMNDVHNAANLIEHPNLVPDVGDVSADAQACSEDVVKSSLALLTNTEELVKQVKAAPDQPEMMTWVMFNKRKDVLDAFEALLRSIKTNGQRAKFLEVETEDPEEEKKSYVQKQFETASKWLLRPSVKAEVKTNGQQAVRNLVQVANKITEDLKGHDKEDMSHLIMETEQLLTECTKKYDHEQYSVLMERVRELKKTIERGVVTRVVEDFMEAEAPLADLDILADHEKDETKRKFLLEKKIAELLAHLSRITKTARLIADTDTDGSAAVSTQLNTCSEQAELLAPMLVKAAQQRVAAPDDKVVIDNYKSLLARYAESLSKIRDLCDQSVDPMDFVQTAGETMQRMREESTKHNDPMKCAHTSAAITKLANRVMHVGLSSRSARSDPELQSALARAQQQLPRGDAHARASRLPDWKDTTAQSLRATEEVESLLGGESIFMKQPEPNQPIYNEALNLHAAVRDWSSRDNEIVAVAKRMAVLMAKLSNYMNNDKQREVLATSKSIVTESHEVARLAKKLAHECTDHRIKTNLLQACERIPTISGQLKMLTTVKGFSLGRHGTQEDKEAMDMLVGNAQSLMLSIQDVVKGAASASVKIMSQRGLRMKWVRKTIY